MSELLECNYCTWQGIKARAAREGKTAELRGGRWAYVDGEEVAIFMLLTTSCCC